MATRSRQSPERLSEILDVELLDVLAQIEALLRSGREVQRQALRVRGLPAPATLSQRKGAATKIQKVLVEMNKDCGALSEIVQQLRDRADDLRESFDTE